MAESTISGHRASAGYDADAWIDRAHMTPETLHLAAAVVAVAREHGGLPPGRLDEDDIAALNEELMEGIPPRTP